MASATNVIRYAVRPSILTAETTYQVSEDALSWSAGTRGNHVPLGDIVSVRIFTSPAVRYRFVADAPFGGLDMLVLKLRDGRSLSVRSKHYRRFGVFEDRAATFIPFVNAVISRVGEVNPTARFVSGMPTALWWLWIVVSAIVALAMTFGVLMVIIAATGDRDLPGLILGLVFAVASGLSLRSTLKVVRSGRQRPFDPRAGTTTG